MSIDIDIASPHRQPSILLVDDDPFMLEEPDDGENETES